MIVPISKMNPLFVTVPSFVIVPLFVSVTLVPIVKVVSAFTVIVAELVKSLGSVTSVAIVFTGLLPLETEIALLDKIEPLVLFSVPVVVIVP